MGDVVGDVDGAIVGALVGATVGAIVGDVDGAIVGALVGALVGARVGLGAGGFDGDVLGVGVRIGVAELGDGDAFATATPVVVAEGAGDGDELASPLPGVFADGKLGCGEDGAGPKLFNPATFDTRPLPASAGSEDPPPPPLHPANVSAKRAIEPIGIRARNIYAMSVRAREQTTKNLRE